MGERAGEEIGAVGGDGVRISPKVVRKDQTSWALRERGLFVVCWSSLQAEWFTDLWFIEGGLLVWPFS